MGQRTLTLISYVDNKGKKTNNAYYNHWGIGRVQLNAIIGNFLLEFGESKLDLSKSKDMINVNDSFQDIDFNSLNFEDLSVVKDLVDKSDNNNGGIVLIADDINDSIKIGFFLGEEECYDTDDTPCSRFVSFDEWREKVGKRYVDDSYTKMFISFCRNFNIKFIE